MFKNINKKIVLSTMALTAVVASPIAVVIACGNKQESKPKDLTSENPNYNAGSDSTYKIDKKWSKEKSNKYFPKHGKSPLIDWKVVDGYYDAEIVRWIDGDTPIIKWIDQSPFVRTHIRIQSIDTPELHFGDGGKETEGAEFVWANKAKEFGEHEMPAGTKVRIVSNGEESYDRVVGQIFYNSKKNQGSEIYDKSYSVEIMERGLALPFMRPFGSQVAMNKWEVNKYVGLPFADSYNYAKTQQIGLFGNKDISDILKIHGETNPEFVTYRGRNPEENEQDTIYDLLSRDINKTK